MLYEKILSLCQKTGISVARLEKEAELGNATIRGWRKSSPTAANLKRVADILGCTIDELLKED